MSVQSPSSSDTSPRASKNSLDDPPNEVSPTNENASPNDNESGNRLEVIESNPGSRFTVVALSYPVVLGICACLAVLVYWFL